MSMMKFGLVVGVVSLMSGCATQMCKTNDVALSGTDTAIVGLYIDKKGYPQPSVQTVSVYPGQRVLFAGPKQFDIIFKEQKSPNGKLEMTSKDGVVVVDVPRDIFDREKSATRANPDSRKELLFHYGIKANGKETDPTIRIMPR
jgi:hypothetical protein